ncbi:MULTISPECIES: ABC transporter permease [unclassified Kitasatospora]|uniref:ABC transporter permease n=1 Tax=unclassified Kitasatospora TaxID=2633591 RepID=UPI00070EB36C|nr:MULTISPECIES: ABC transporter permease [unclassified Kitasatospora]KQV05740.1 ABC transporter [Kitasatospora sp. Root107]KRB62544.1 ABC transporter [Kitasatospora sp. Root187]
MSAATLSPATVKPAPLNADDVRIGPRATLRHIGALTRRNLMRIKADPESMLDAVLVPIIFTVLFIYVFGGAMFPTRAQYIQYMVPGLLGTTGLNLAMAVGTGLNSDFQTGVMDRFRTLPIGRSAVLLSKMAAEMLRALVSFTILITFAMIIGLEIKTDVLHLLAAVGLSLMFGMSIVWISMLLGMSLSSPQAVQGVSMLVIMPLQFGSSIFAPTGTMPGWLQTFTEYNPLSALADACRGLINGEAFSHSVLIVVIWSVAITAVTAPLAVARFRKRT